MLGMGTRVAGAPKETCDALASEGFVGFSPIRRPTNLLAGHFEDILDGVAYVAKLPYVDEERIGIMGFSRGGLLTFIIAVEKPIFNAIVIMAPSQGVDLWLDDYLPNAGYISAPVLILVSQNDTVEADHVETSQKVKDALESAGKQSELIIYPPYGNDGHQMFFDMGDYWIDIQRFLKSVEIPENA